MNKKPWQSKTMWGGVIMLTSLIASSFGLEISADEQATFVDMALSSIDEVGGFIGFIMVLWGRLTANTSISL